MVVNNLKELEKELQKRINNALTTDVADVVENVMSEHIQEDVYDVYEPTNYVRREDDGGLLDKKNIVSTVDVNGELCVQNVTVGNKNYVRGGKEYTSKNAGKPIDEVIETGQGYDIHGWEYDGVSRPFMGNTRDDLKENHTHTEALKQGLRKQGLEVK